MKRVLHLVYLFLCLSGCLSLPSPPNAPFVAYSINSQRPPVARVGQPFSWSFLPGTFNTSNGTGGLSFQTDNLPLWASFAPETRTIYGTPDSSYLGTTIVRITAYNAAKSSSVTDTLRLLVTTGQAPTVKLPLGSQLGNGSVLGSAKYDHATQGISVPPNWSWSIGLLPDTFVTNNGAGIYYTAYEAGTTSLPSWMKFNTVTATFDGVSPNEQQDTWITVYGSDHFGYGDVQQTFRFTVSQHTLDLVAPLPAINATAASIVNYTIPLGSLTIDGVPKNSSTAVQVNVDLSEVPYLTFDEENLSISGSLPQSLAAFTNVSIPILISTPSCHNNISTQVFLRVVPGLFTAPVLPPFYVHPNEQFSFDLKQFTSNLNATYSLGGIAPQAAQQWIHFSADPLTLSGQAPSEYALAGQNITIDLEASGLNGLKSSALLPVFFIRTQRRQTGRFSRGLSNLAKTMLAIILGSVGSLLLLILMMRTCRTHCSEDGQRERHEEDAIYQSYFTYTGEKFEEPKATESPNKGTPLSAGDTLIDSRSPRWDEKAGVGGPMMAITQNELALVGESQSSHSGLKRLDIFNVFAKPSRVDVVRSSTHPSLQGLGIVASDHRVVNVTTDSDTNVTGERDYESENSGSIEAGSAGNRATSSEDQRSSWNTTGSSSLFYSDTQGEESEVGSSSRSGNESRYLATPSGSTPRRRKDFKTGHSLKDQGLSTSSSGSSNDVDIGTIRMVSKAETGTSLDVASHDDEAIACSESLGAIKTASYRKISPESFASGALSSETASGSVRPTLIPFQSKQVPKGKSMLPCSTAYAPSPEGAEDDRASLHPFDSRPRGGPHVEHDIGTSQRLSAQSVPYDFQASGSRSGSPTTSAIFFSPPRELNSQISHAKPSTLSENHAEATKMPVQPRSPDMDNDPTAHRKYSSQQPRSETFGSLVGPVIVTVGVGEPFHVTPSMKPESHSDMKQLQSAKNPFSKPGSRFYALTDYPNEPSKDRKQLPEWLHFDAREYEIWGIPRKTDVGLIAVQLIERKSIAPSSIATSDPYESATSPALGRQEEVEEVVARFILDVVDKSNFKGPGHGDVSIVTF